MLLSISAALLTVATTRVLLGNRAKHIRHFLSATTLIVSLLQASAITDMKLHLFPKYQSPIDS
jgi:hypothetical protein